MCIMCSCWRRNPNKEAALHPRPPVATTMGTPAAAAVCSTARVPGVSCCCGLSSVPSTSLQAECRRAERAGATVMRQGQQAAHVARQPEVVWQPPRTCDASTGQKATMPGCAHLTISSTFRRPVSNASAAEPSAACVLGAARQRPRLRRLLVHGGCCREATRWAGEAAGGRAALAAVRGGKLAAALLQRRRRQRRQAGQH